MTAPPKSRCAGGRPPLLRLGRNTTKWLGGSPRSVSDLPIIPFEAGLKKRVSNWALSPFANRSRPPVPRVRVETRSSLLNRKPGRPSTALDMETVEALGDILPHHKPRSTLSVSPELNFRWEASPRDRPLTCRPAFLPPQLPGPSRACHRSEPAAKR